MGVRAGQVGNAQGRLTTLTVGEASSRQATGLNTALPTSAPGSDTFSYTLQASDFPVVAGAEKVFFACAVYAYGRNLDTVSSIVHCTPYLNGSAWGSDYSAGANVNYYWTAQAFIGPATTLPAGVTAGDVIGMRLYQHGTTAVKMNQHGIWCFPAAIRLGKAGEAIFDVIVKSEYASRPSSAQFRNGVTRISYSGYWLIRNVDSALAGTQSILTNEADYQFDGFIGKNVKVDAASIDAASVDFVAYKGYVDLSHTVYARSSAFPYLYQNNFMLQEVEFRKGTQLNLPPYTAAGVK